MKTLLNFPLSISTTLQGHISPEYQLTCTTPSRAKGAGRATYRFSAQMTDRPNEDGQALPNNGHTLPDWVEKIIMDHLADPAFGKEKLGRATDLSPNQLVRKLKSQTGCTPNKLIRKMRLHEAKWLLGRPNMNISEVAYSVGFNDPNYFARRFIKEFGVSPSAFRKCGWW